ncbi:MAG TPA: hypothetical protein VKG26_12405 [Bacteroidia bacterium]|nr:hypothetical protein [Bacteroidia bacterium]
MSYYRATKAINKTALLEFIKEETIKNKDIVLKVYELGSTVYLYTPQAGYQEKIDELYPNIFKKSNSPPL